MARKTLFAWSHTFDADQNGLQLQGALSISEGAPKALAVRVTEQPLAECDSNDQSNLIYRRLEFFCAYILGGLHT